MPSTVICAVGTAPSAAAVTVTPAGSGCAAISSRSSRRCSPTPLPAGKADCRKIASRFCACSVLTGHLPFGRGWPGSAPRRARPCRTRAGIPAGRRATASLPPGQVSRRHRITMIHATRPGAPNVVMILTPAARRREHRVRVGPGQSADGALAAVVRAVVHDDEDPGGVLVLRAGHDLAGEVRERRDPGGEGGGGEHLPGVHVQAGQQREGAFALVLVLVADGPSGRGGQGGMQAAAGIDLRLGAGGQDPVAGAERLVLAAALVKVQDHLRPGFEVRVAGEDPATGTAMA